MIHEHSFWNTSVVFRHLSDLEFRSQIKLSAAVAEMTGLPVKFVIKLHYFSGEWELTVLTHVPEVTHELPTNDEVSDEDPFVN